MWQETTRVCLCAVHSGTGLNSLIKCGIYVDVFERDLLAPLDECGSTYSPEVAKVLMSSNIRITSLPLSLNHLENKECELISTRRDRGYVLLSRIASLFESALQSVVFPVPGGPCSSTHRLKLMMDGSTPASENLIAVETYLNRQ